MTHEVKKFDAEVGKVLQLMIHSLYSSKEVAIRELISNASDACDKLKFESQTNADLMKGDTDLKIKIHIDKEKKTLTISDNGIGMNKSELEQNLGTIAASGTQKFLNNLTGDAKKDNHLIGQFGVGFYSAFMIADQVTVRSKKAGENMAYVWHSEGKGEYTIASTDEEINRGTQIILHIKEDQGDFLDHFRVKFIVKNYSDHIAAPIYFIEENKNEVQVNSSSALWTRPKSEISEEDYKDFYKNIAHAADDPWITLHNQNEIPEYTNLLFVPSNKTFDLFHPDRKSRIKLYIKRVFIADETINLVPHYLRFVRGVVDCAELPLNITRETLQHNSILEKVKNSITKKVLSELKKKKSSDAESYIQFWENFGAALKEGLCEATSDHEKLLDVCLFRSALHNKYISLDEYLENIKDDKKTIYFLSGDDPEKLANSPQIEGFLSKGKDVLLFTDTVDDFWVNVNSKYKDAEIISVTRADLDIDEKPDVAESDNLQDDAKKDENNKHQALIDYFKNILGANVKDIKISKKLTSSPSCLAVDAGSMDIRMERFLIEQKQLQRSTAKILEINVNHSIVQKIENAVNNNKADDKISDLAFMLFDQACILEGEPVSDSAAFAKRLNNIIETVA